MQIKKVDLFLHTMLFDTCRSFTCRFAEALTRQGVSCRLIDVDDGEMRVHFQEILADPPDCTLCFTIKGSFQGTFFCESFNIPHFTYMLDSTIYFNELKEVPNLAMGVIDENDCEFQRKFPKFEDVLFLPHAVHRDVQYDPQSQRPYEVTMIGALFDYERMRASWPKKYPAEIVEMMEKVIEKVQFDPDVYFVFAFLEETGKRHIEWTDLDPREVLQQIEGYFRSYERVQLIRAIKDAQVHVFGPGMLGEGWEKYLGAQENVTIHPPVMYEQSLKIIEQSRLILNCTPSYRKGAHERIFNGLGLGALVLTGENLYLPGQFKDREEILYYRPMQMEDVNDLVNHYLANENERKKVVDQGRSKVLNAHTWDHRAAAFLNTMPAYIVER